MPSGDSGLQLKPSLAAPSYRRSPVARLVAGAGVPEWFNRIERL